RTLFRRTELENGHRAQRHAGFQRDRDRRVGPGQLLQRQAQREVIAAHPAVLLRERQPEQPHIAHLLDDVVREFAGLVETCGLRRDDAPGEILDGGAERLLLRIELVVRHSLTFLKTGWLPFCRTPDVTAYSTHLHTASLH